VPVLPPLHTLPTHDCPLAHAWPQEPQFCALLETSMHWVPQRCWPLGHAQLPPTQPWPPLQTTSHWPQFSASVSALTQLLPQGVSPVWHELEQRFWEQN
jgi:hypothetical protein